MFDLSIRIRKIIQAPKKSRHGILALGVVTVGTVLASISPSYADDTLYATNSSYISPPSFSLEGRTSDSVFLDDVFIPSIFNRQCSLGFESRFLE